MKKFDPWQIRNSPPCLFGSLGALALLVAVIVLPAEMFGYETRHLFGAIIIWSFLLVVGGIFLWAIVQRVFGKKRDGSGAE